jgi:hypothetical protein
MPWYGHAPDAPDTHRIWADDGSAHEAALRASGWRYEVPAPGSTLPEEQPPPADEAAVPSPVVAQPAPEPSKKGHRRAAVDR